VSTRSVSPTCLSTGRPIACTGSDLSFPTSKLPVPLCFSPSVVYGRANLLQIHHSKPFIIPHSFHYVSISPLPIANYIAYTRPIASLLSTTANMPRPAKKRCQYKVVYNIPTLPKEGDKPTDGSSPPKPEMTANPTQCPSAAMRIAGDCPHCQKVFCSGHRTPESHHWYVPSTTSQIIY